MSKNVTLYNKGLRSIHCKRGESDFEFVKGAAVNFPEDQAAYLRKMYDGEIISVADDTAKFDKVDDSPIVEKKAPAMKQVAPPEPPSTDDEAEESDEADADETAKSDDSAPDYLTMSYDDLVKLAVENKVGKRGQSREVLIAALRGE